MRLLYITENVEDYDKAFYQRDVLRKLKERHDVTTYGMGYEEYDKSHTIQDVLSLMDGSPDVICIGHKWLRNLPGNRADPHPNLDLTETTLPCAMILNKEYTNFDEKIKYIQDNEIPLVFTHHHNADKWTDQYGTQFVFWPFAVDPEKFRDYGEETRYDLAFSGLLRNPNPAVEQTDLRIRVQRELFYSIGQLKLVPRLKYREYDLFWRGKPTTRIYRYLNRMLHREKRLSDDEYRKLYNRSKLSFNTLSPVGLVGTRYYEAMASNSLAFCQESDIYSEYGLFEPGEHCVTFSEDLSDFEEKLAYYTSHDAERERIAQQGHDHVLANHTWTDRIEEFTQTIEDEIL